MKAEGKKANKIPQSLRVDDGYGPVASPVAIKQGVAQQESLHAEAEWEVLLDRAAAEGILEPQQHTDGCWYVELGEGLWKEAVSDFWCRHCNQAISAAGLASHLDSIRHCKRLAAAKNPAPRLPQASEASVSRRKTSPSRSDASKSDASRPLEKWQERDVDGNIWCSACDELVGVGHENTPKHRRLIAQYLQDLDAKYPEPKEPWLAWVPCEDCGDGRYLKCLLCNKWAVDFEGTDTAFYKGQHSRLSVKNQKNHYKKMRNLKMYMSDHAFWSELLAERAQWHPPQQSQAVAPRSGSEPRKQPRSPRRPAKPALPDGWFAEWSEEHGRFYYYSDNHPAQWQAPTTPASAPADRPRRIWRVNARQEGPEVRVQ